MLTVGGGRCDQDVGGQWAVPLEAGHWSPPVPPPAPQPAGASLWESGDQGCVRYMFYIKAEVPLTTSEA